MIQYVCVLFFVSAAKARIQLGIETNRYDKEQTKPLLTLTRTPLFMIAGGLISEYDWLFCKL